MHSFKKWTVGLIASLILIPSFTYGNEIFPLAKAKNRYGEKMDIQLECAKKDQDKCVEFDLVVISQNTYRPDQNSTYTWIKGLPVARLEEFEHFYKDRSYPSLEHDGLLYVGTLFGWLCATKCSPNHLSKYLLLPLGVAFDIAKAPVAIPYIIGLKFHSVGERLKINKIFKRLKQGQASRPLKLSMKRATYMLASFKEWKE